MTFPEAILSRDHLREGGRNMFDSTDREGRQEGGSMGGGTVKVDEDL